MLKIYTNILFDKVLKQAIEIEEGVELSRVYNLEEVKSSIMNRLQQLHDTPARLEQPVIVHLDVGAMYPNIILTVSFYFRLYFGVQKCTS